MKRILAFILLAALLLPVSGIAENGKYTIIDSHLHYLDFLQETDGFEALVKKMDEANVSHAVIFGMGMAKQWDEHAPKAPTYYLSNDSRCYYYTGTDYILMTDYLAQPEDVQARFFPFICGINPNDLYSASQLRRLLGCQVCGGLPWLRGTDVQEQPAEDSHAVLLRKSVKMQDVRPAVYDGNRYAVQVCI